MSWRGTTPNPSASCFLTRLGTYFTHAVVKAGVSPTRVSEPRLCGTTEGRQTGRAVGFRRVHAPADDGSVGTRDGPAGKRHRVLRRLHIFTPAEFPGQAAGGRAPGDKSHPGSGLHTAQESGTPRGRDIPLPPDIPRDLSGPIQESLGREPVGAIERLRFPGDCANATIKLLVRNSGGSPRFIALVSPRDWPGVVAKSMEAARGAGECLGDDVGSVILAPVYNGEVGGRSCAILPYRRPLSNIPGWRSLKNRLMHRPVLDWLRRATQRTANEIPPSDLESRIAAPLRHLGSLVVLGEEFSRATRKGLERLESGAWRPRQVLMHGDLTRGNILQAGPSTGSPGPARSNFVLIDWAGAQLRGYPFFDLVSFARSMGLRGRGLRKEIEEHGRILHCTPEDARSSVLAALGYTGLHLDQFPLDQFILLAKDCFRTLEAALSAR
jgi:hypothetical protein